MTTRGKWFLGFLTIVWVICAITTCIINDAYPIGAAVGTSVMFGLGYGIFFHDT